MNTEQKQFPSRIVKTGTGLVVGLDKNGVLKTDMLYSVRRIMGELVLTEAGATADADSKMNVFDLVEEGTIFVTREEMDKIRPPHNR